MSHSPERLAAPKKPSCSRIFYALSLSIAIASPALAQAPVLTEQESLRIGLARPDIVKLIESTRAVAASELAAAGRWPNPTLELQREAIPSAGARTTERSYLVSQQLDLAGRRGLNKAAARERAWAVTADTEQMRLDSAGEIKQRFYEALYRKELVAATQAWDTRIAAVGSTVQKLHKGGEVAGYDKRRVELELATVRARLRADRAAYGRALQQLLALTVGVPANSVPQGALLPPDAAPLESLLARLDQRPELRALARRADAFALERKAAQRGWIPDVTVGLGSKTVDNGLARERGTVVALSMPLPLFNRDQDGAAKAAAQAGAAQAETQLKRARLEGELRGLWQQVRELTGAALEYNAQYQSQSVELSRIADASYKGGETGLLELLDACRALHEAQVRALELSWTARQGAIELDTFADTGTP